MREGRSWAGDCQNATGGEPGSAIWKQSAAVSSQRLDSDSQPARKSAFSNAANRKHVLLPLPRLFAKLLTKTLFFVKFFFFCDCAFPFTKCVRQGRAINIKINFAFAGHIAATKSPQRNEVVSSDPPTFSPFASYVAERGKKAKKIKCRRNKIETQ